MRRRWLVLGVATPIVLIGALVAVSWHFSSAVLVPDHSYWPEDVVVERVSPDRISLSHSEDADRPGVYGLEWPGGHAVVGPVVAGTDDSVTRKLHTCGGTWRKA